MKFIHTADIHLGAVPDKGMPWSEQRGQELWQSFRALVKTAEREQADLLLIAGDLFHRQPLARELKEVNYLFGRLSRTQVVVIAGNHDYISRDSHYRDFQWEENVTWLMGPECESVFFPELQTTVYGFSYFDREITQPEYDELRPENRGGYHILLAHGGDAQHIPMDYKRMLGNGFHYIAMGHIHKPRIMAEGRMAYAGALEPIDVNDTGEHGYILGELKGRSLQTSFVPFAGREYIHLEVSSDTEMTDLQMQERVAESIQKNGMENIYKIILKGYRDPDIVFQPRNYRIAGYILEVEDQTEPDYDFGRMRRDHGNDVVGRYIDRLWEEDLEPGQRSIRRQALYLGLQALLDPKK